MQDTGRQCEINTERNRIDDGRDQRARHDRRVESDLVRYHRKNGTDSLGEDHDAHQRDTYDQCDLRCDAVQQNQLEKHLTQFGTEEIKVLLTLDPKPMKESLMDSFGTVLKKYNADKINEIKTPIRHVNITFEQLVAAMEDIVDERDSEIMAVLDDYKKYCFDEKLIPDDENWMRAIVAGTTLEDNLKYDFYYDQASRGYSGHGYIGLYKGKSIRAIGKLKKTVVAELVNGEVSYINESGEAATKEEIEKIKEAIVHAESEYGYNLKTVQTRYFIVEHFYPTNFKKASKNPIQKSKYFNLAEMFKSKTLPKTDEIASILDGKTWEEFY